MHYFTLRERDATCRILAPEWKGEGCPLVTNMRLLFGSCAQSLVI